MDANQRVAIVTGGSSGLGRAIALALSKAGFNVAIAARSEQPLMETVQLIEQSGGHVFAIQADVTNRQAVEQLASEVETKAGPIDLLVNNAGSFRAFGLISEIDPDEWWCEIETNLRGPLLCSGVVLPRMIARRRGRIINMASAAGLQPFETVSAYCVSKTALIRFSESLAMETRDQGIAVFAINPGTVRTPMSDYVVQTQIVKQKAPMVQQWYQHLYQSGQDTPIDQVIRLVLFLASGQADSLSGCFLSVDDDVEELIRHADEIQQNGQYRLRLHT
jgi:NAD(P)-dependent dehydrogenase (short-subunit alcohol dehydrogenase family)